LIDQSLVGFMLNYQMLCSLLSMSADVGRKLQSCKEEEEHENALTITSSPPHPQNPPSLPQKKKTHAIQ
jgi:hypothetical protein